MATEEQLANRAEAWETLKALFPLVVLFGILGALGLFARDAWQRKHTPFPRAGSGKRFDAYSYTAAFLQEHKANVVGSDIAYSDPPFWETPCRDGEYGVRVTAPVIDPATGVSSDVTMYFCYLGSNLIYPANQQAQFYTQPR